MADPNNTAAHLERLIAGALEVAYELRGDLLAWGKQSDNMPMGGQTPPPVSPMNGRALSLVITKLDEARLWLADGRPKP